VESGLFKGSINGAGFSHKVLFMEQLNIVFEYIYIYIYSHIGVEYVEYDLHPALQMHHDY